MVSCVLFTPEQDVRLGVAISQIFPGMAGDNSAMMRRSFAAVAACCGLLLSLLPAYAQQTVAIPLPGGKGIIKADLYGSGERAVLLAHGGRFNKESWAKQAAVLAHSGFRVLAVQFRGDRLNPNGSPGSFGSDEENAEDVLAAVAYLHSHGSKDVFAIGGSLGGNAVGEASARSAEGDMARIVLLGSDGGGHPEGLKGRKLFLISRDDSNGEGLRLPGIRQHFERAPEPKKLVVVEGSAHAQFLFDTDQGSRVLNEILEFLTAK